VAGNPAPNAVVVPVVDYGPDPWGWSMVGALQRRIAGTLNGARYVGPRAGAWHGWTQPLQQFRGHAGLGAARVFAPKSSTMQDQNTTQSLAAAIFLDRAGS
jgi:hypothetical protein